MFPWFPYRHQEGSTKGQRNGQRGRATSQARPLGSDRLISRWLSDSDSRCHHTTSARRHVIVSLVLDYFVHCYFYIFIFLPPPFLASSHLTLQNPLPPAPMQHKRQFYHATASDLCDYPLGDQVSWSLILGRLVHLAWPMDRWRWPRIPRRPRLRPVITTIRVRAHARHQQSHQPPLSVGSCTSAMPPRSCPSVMPTPSWKPSVLDQHVCTTAGAQHTAW